MLARLSLCVVAGWLAVPGHGDAPPRPESLDLGSIAAIAMQASQPPGGEDSPPYPEFSAVTKGMTKREGLFTLWHYPAEARDKDPERLLAQIPASFLGEQFMLSTSVSGGGFFTGFPLDERVVKWEKLDRQLVLVQPETRYVVDRSKEVSDVVERTYPERIRVAVPILTQTPGGDPVIDLGALLKSEFADISWMSGGFMPFGFGGGGGMINPALSKWTKKKSFELNVEIGVELAVSNSAPPGSYDKKLVHYSFWKLPASDYTPRIADDRVGYFLTANQDWGKPTDARDLYNRYIDRWHLVKRDPSLKKCEPRQPIVFYIEKTVPVKYRRAVRDGILDWNRAYEQIGFLNAVEVRQQTDDNEWKDLDPEDMRYSFFRWIVTGAGFAMGPHRANPFTGQIYDADIIFDDSMVRYFEHEAGRMLPSTAVARKTDDPALRAFLEQHPEWNRPTSTWTTISLGDNEEPRVRDAIRERLRHQGCHFCDYADGMKHQMAVAGAALAGQPPEVIDEFLYQVIREVVMHEVGHTLGLRHNFKASSIYTLEEIERRRGTGEPLVGSVMDYNPVLFFADGTLDANFITPTIGPYDQWAIEYGYRPFDGSFKPAEDKPASDEPAGDAPDRRSASADASDGTDGGTAAAGTVTLDDIPKDILDKLPPEVRQAIQSGAISAGGGGPTPPTPPKGGGPVFKAPPSGEEGMLQQIAARSTEPELAYATDEDTTYISPDPRSNRFDMAADPVNWAKTRVKLVDARMADILKWAVKDEESWYHLRDTFMSLVFEKVTVLDYVGRYVGGLYFNRAHRGDKGAEPPFVVVDAATQRAALSFIEETLYNDEFLTFSPEVLNHLAPPRWYHDGAMVDVAMDFPVHDIVGVLQWWNLFDRLFPQTLRRIHDAELKVEGGDRVTVAEYLQRIRNAVWAASTDTGRLTRGTWTDAKPYVSDLRRSLQREYLGIVEPLVRQRPGAVLSPDLHAMVRYSVKELGDQIGETLKAIGTDGKGDFASRAHLDACKSRIERMLAPELQEYGPSAGGGMMFGRPAAAEPR
jgi:hypothetical protein